MKKTIGYRVLALSLVVVLSVGAFAGCKKGTTSSDIDSDMSVSDDDYFVYDVIQHPLCSKSFLYQSN